MSDIQRRFHIELDVGYCTIYMYSIIVKTNLTNVLHVTQKKAIRDIFPKNRSLSNFDFNALSDIERRFDIEVDVGNNRKCRQRSTVCIVKWNVCRVSIIICAKFHKICFYFSS